MQRNLYQAAVQLLAAGAAIEELSSAPIVYRLVFERQSAPIPGWVVQQLQAQRAVREVCRVNGRRRFLAC